jgi:hypothetical protein
MRTLPPILILIGLVALPSVIQSQRRPPFSSGACFDSTSKGDSAFVVAQASQAFGHDSVKVSDFQVIRDGSQKEGTIVRLVPTNPRTRGGGALVWVDGDTFCAIVLRRYQ